MDMTAPSISSAAVPSIEGMAANLFFYVIFKVICSAYAQIGIELDAASEPRWFVLNDVRAQTGSCVTSPVSMEWQTVLRVGRVVPFELTS